MDQENNVLVEFCRASPLASSVLNPTLLVFYWSDSAGRFALVGPSKQAMSITVLRRWLRCFCRLLVRRVRVCFSRVKRNATVNEMSRWTERGEKRLGLLARKRTSARKGHLGPTNHTHLAGFLSFREEPWAEKGLVVETSSGKTGQPSLLYSVVPVMPRGVGDIIEHSNGQAACCLAREHNRDSSSTNGKEQKNRATTDNFSFPDQQGKMIRITVKNRERKGLAERISNLFLLPCKEGVCKDKEDRSK